MNNIGFAKIGKSTKFSKKNYSPIGGDNEASCVLRALANNNPDKTFYIIGRSDFSRLSDHEKLDLFPYDNVVDIWERNTLTCKDPEFYTYVGDYFKSNNIELDFTVMMVGQVGTVTIPNKIIQVKHMKEGITTEKPAAVIDMTKNYTSPISCWINDTNPRYVEIVNDPRYVMNQSRDVFNLPEISLGQYDYEYDTNTIHSYENQERRLRKVKSVYAGMETAFCLDYDYNESTNTDRGTDFMIVLNEGSPSRYNFLKEWVLDKFDDVEVFGKWSEKVTSNDSRFKGSLHISELQKKLADVKFTFIIPIAKGWVTSKYIEMVHAGVIPFLHPTYDEQMHTGIPEFFRPENPQQLKDRIKKLSDDPVLYKKTLSSLRKLILKPEFYDGNFINDKIMNAMYSDYKQVDLLQYEVKKGDTLEDFFS